MRTCKRATRTIRPDFANEPRRSHALSTPFPPPPSNQNALSATLRFSAPNSKAGRRRKVTLRGLLLLCWGIFLFSPVRSFFRWFLSRVLNRYLYIFSLLQKLHRKPNFFGLINCSILVVSLLFCLREAGKRRIFSVACLSQRTLEKSF